MECDACGKKAAPNVDFRCAACVQADLYPLRLEHASLLLEKEELGRRVEAIVADPDNTPRGETTVFEGTVFDMRDLANAIKLQDLKAQIAKANDESTEILARTAALKEEIEQQEKAIEALRAENARRRSDAESAMYNIDARTATERDMLLKSIKMTRRKWDVKHEELVRERLVYCRDAAKLAGLRRIKYVKDKQMKERYVIGQDWDIYDLRDLNSAVSPVPPCVSTSALLTILQTPTLKCLQLLSHKLPSLPPASPVIWVSASPPR